MKLKPLPIDVKVVRKFVSYDPETGLFTKLQGNKRAPAGFVYKPKSWDAYMRVSIKGVNYAAHRIAWVLMTGEQPEFIDHINGLRHDNRFVNLRSVSSSENNLNRAMHRKAKGTYVPHPDADFHP